MEVVIEGITWRSNHLCLCEHLNEVGDMCGKPTVMAMSPLPNDIPCPRCLCQEHFDEMRNGRERRVAPVWELDNTLQCEFSDEHGDYCLNQTYMSLKPFVRLLSGGPRALCKMHYFRAFPPPPSDNAQLAYFLNRLPVRKHSKAASIKFGTGDKPCETT
jgi:hypothetical protein